MGKKLNIASITNELAESAFFRHAQKQEEKLPTPLPENGNMRAARTKPAITDRPTERPGDRATERRTDLPTGLPPDR